MTLYAGICPIRIEVCRKLNNCKEIVTDYKHVHIYGNIDKYKHPQWQSALERVTCYMS